ncbi:hypothetical protein M406DRAFT_334777 [Cryphonectria parasitica EP155]|uniref:Uncharacterized protein n=1 Tax=Cryphonectria parasitica (strain ATCC 38755 / EP155) TaxID=660469 RepID=A0A9P4XUQ8_CRYP1|nr:uncharacterized protein M406DRAFT_334777 [Cryphonectria parasitica EP155]KAF3761172.1 hypothetical protein M406DRAFT_334777 [Cryphonectria parasitica EP155]
MADDKARLAAARKKAQKKAAEAKAKKEKAAAADAADEPKEEAPPAEEDTPTPAPAETEKEPEAAAAAEASEPIGTTGAVEGTAATSSESSAALEAKLAELEKQCAEAKSAHDEAQLMTEALEKKVVSLEMLHKEDEGQIKRLEADLAGAKDENVDLKKKLQKAEAEVLRLSKKEAQDGGGTDNDHLDELEDEERQKLESKIRELEAENTDLKRGIWQERRKNLQPGMDEAGGGHFTNVDLGGAGPHGPHSRKQQQGGFGDFFASGLNALTGAGGQQAYGHEHDDDGFLDDDEDFDEEAFRKAQEDAAKARIERIKEVKRGLKNWEGWRLDLVEGRRGGGEGIGEIFEV